MTEFVYSAIRVVFDMVNNKITNVRSENGPLNSTPDFGHPDMLAKKGWVLVDRIKN